MTWPRSIVVSPSGEDLNTSGQNGGIVFQNWQAEHEYSIGDACKPTGVSDYQYYATVDNATSGSSEPSWGTTIGGTTSDGDQIWRCGKGYKAVVTSPEIGVHYGCCCLGLDFAVLYPTLVIGKGESMVISVDPDNPGCSPYHWAVSGGGTLSSYTGSSVTYLAPDVDNVNCTIKPIITVTEACEQSVELRLAFNTTDWAGTALRFCDLVDCGSGCHLVSGSWVFEGLRGKWEYDCDGIVLAAFFEKYPTVPIDDYVEPDHLSDLCPYQGGEEWGCGYDNPANPCSTTPGATRNDDCIDTILCKGAAGTSSCGDQPCGELWDMRTPEMKAGGCCPINPMTGLPYD